MAGRFGVLALQGDFAKHIETLASLGARAIEVRRPSDLDALEGLIIPGGESTVMGKLMVRHGIDEAIHRRTEQGMRLLGACAGLILLAKRIEESDQPRLGLLDVTVRRNAYGRQIESFEAMVDVAPLKSRVKGVFIRAPIITELGADAEPIATLDGAIVGARQGAITGIAFHPELTDDSRFHKWWIRG